MPNKAFHPDSNKSAYKLYGTLPDLMSCRRLEPLSGIHACVLPQEVFLDVIGGPGTNIHQWTRSTF